MLTSVKPKPKIPFFDETTDDMDSYLERFEWVAENCNWDKEDWPFHLSQYLRGRLWRHIHALLRAIARIKIW